MDTVNQLAAILDALQTSYRDINVRLNDIADDGPESIVLAAQAEGVLAAIRRYELQLGLATQESIRARG